MSHESDLTAAVIALAREEGFAAAAVAPAGPVPHADRFREWLRRGWHGSMAYMARHRELRLGQQPIVEGARSVLCLAAAHGGDESSSSLVARYARGRDYHKVLKTRCHRLMDRLRALETGFAGRAFVDSGPLPERSLAAWSGLGWIGRNGCLYVPALGSYVLLCGIVCNLSLTPGRPIESPCAGCGACREACPTGAIGQDGLVDSRRCISYLTIEHRGGVPRELWPLMGCRLFGCDRCQEACPHNRPAAPARSPSPAAVAPPADCRLAPAKPPLGGASLADVLRWTREDWDAATRGSACRRATWQMFLRNAVIAAGNSGDASLRGTLEELRRRGGVDAELTDWAAGRLA